MSPLIAGGLELMLVGMGTVFVFLTLLVFATQAMSALVMRFAPVAVSEQPQPDAEVSAEEVAAISIALAEHLKYNRGNNS